MLHTSGYGKYLGRVNVVFDPSGEVRSFNGDPIVLDHSRKEDPELRGIVDRYRAEIDKKMNVAVGHSLEYVDGGRPGCRLYECAFGDLATDAMAAEMNVGMAILNSGAIKGSFNAGPITMGDVIQAMPWSNSVDVVRIPGSALISILEHSVSQYDASHPDPGGRFLQLSGLTVTFDVRRTIGQRVVEARVAVTGEKVDETAEYDVAVSSFMVKGGDGYKMIPENLIEYRNTGFLDNDLLVSYIRKNTPIRPPTAGRIIMVNDMTAAASALTTTSIDIIVSAIMIATSSASMATAATLS